MSNNSEYSGQWVGELDGTNKGFLILNIDSDRNERAVLHFHDYDIQKPSFTAHFRLDVSQNQIKGFSYQVGLFLLPSNNFEAKDGKEALPENISFRGEFSEENDLKIVWESDIDTNGSAMLTLQEHKVVRDGIKISWEEYKDLMFRRNRSCEELIYRGQFDYTLPLKTSFHRKGRCNLIRYVNEDLKKLNRFIATTVGKRFDLSDPYDFSELVFLAQHHGYPTPFLDWSYSPFVAAYFAFSVLPKDTSNGCVRLFELDTKKWRKHGTDIVTSFSDPRMSFTSLNHLVSSNNERALPQQSLVMFSNILDIEGLIRKKELQSEIKLLKVYDIDYSERADAMKDLDIMGITKASLFPGIDGICGALAESDF